MTFASNPQAPRVVALCAAIATAGCDPLPSQQPGAIEQALAGLTHRAPIVAALERNDATTECRVEHWRDLHPDDPERAWGPLARLEVVGLDRSSEALSSVPHFLVTVEEMALQEVQVLMVAPWSGDAEIVCGGEAFAAGGMVLVADIIADGLSLGGFSSDEAYDLAEENVLAEGLEGVVDIELTEPDPCLHEEPPCINNEPLAPDE